MEPETLGKMISNKKRNTILQIIGQRKSITASECYTVFKRKYDQKVRREAIYRELECLRSNKLLKKSYNEKQKKLCYSLEIEKLVLDLRLMKIDVIFLDLK